MTLYTPSGRLTVDNRTLIDGTLILSDSMITVDGEFLFNFVDHTVPIYAFASNLQSKAKIGDYLSYFIKFECVNIGDPGREISISVNIPSGFDLVKAHSDEGEYSETTGKWVLKLNKDHEAYLYFIVDVINAGTQTQTATQDGTATTISNNCVTSLTDTEGGIVSHDVDLQDYPNTLANMQDGQEYTLVSYSKVHETGVTGIHDGILNNRLSVLAVNKTDNLINPNAATGTNLQRTTAGFSNYGTTIESSGDWGVNTGERSLKVLCPGTQTGERAWAPSFIIPVAGNSYVGQITFKGTAGDRFVVVVQLLNSPYTSFATSAIITATGAPQTINVAGICPSGATNIGVLLRKDNISTNPFYIGRVYLVEGSFIPDGVMDMATGDIVNGKQYLSNRATVQDSIEKIICTFIYDSSKELYIRRHDEYKSVTTSTTDRWYGLCINEGLNFEYKASSNLLSNPNAFLDNTSYSELTLPGASESATYIFTFPIPTLNGDNNPFYSGLIAKLNSFKPNTNVQLQIKSSTGNESSKQSAYSTGTGEIVFGEIDDLWDLLPNDLNGAILIISVTVSNSSQEQQIFQYANLILHAYYQDDQTKGKLGFSFGGRHLRNFGGHLTDDEHPVGINKTISTLEEAKSDGVLITDDSAGSKTIATTITLVDDDLSAAWEQANRISRWLATPKNEYQFPELQELIFDYNQSRVYMAELAEEIEVTKEHPKLVLKASFIVPSGVALSIDPKITGANDKNDGIVKAKPLIVFEANGSSSITITENTTGNSFTIDTTVASGTILTLDNETRKVTDENDVDYEEFISGDSTRLILLPKTAYSFSITGGSIKYVSFKEKF